MIDQLIQLVYLVATALFIFSLKWMSDPTTARRGVFAGVGGMALAIIGTLMHPLIIGYSWVAIPFVLGALAGVPLSWVPLTAVPQRTALSHAFGGLAAGLVGTAKYYLWAEHGELTTFRMGAIGLEVILGYLTCTGSLVAAGKLQEVIPTRPIMYRGQNIINFALLAAAIAHRDHADDRSGPHVSVSRADPPRVVVRSPARPPDRRGGYADGHLAPQFVCGPRRGRDGVCDGEQAAHHGRRARRSIRSDSVNRDVQGDEPIVHECAVRRVRAGAGRAARRSSSDPPKARRRKTPRSCSRTRRPWSSSPATAWPSPRRSIGSTILYEQLAKRGIDVKFAIHPVAGRMPGHMNVLLAEAEIPYDRLVEMDDINPEMPRADVALVIGANDVVNPAARLDKNSPIFGMPIIDADKAKVVLAIKRSMNPGFAGIENDLYFADNTLMLFGDAKNVIGEVVKNLSGQSGTSRELHSQTFATRASDDRSGSCVTSCSLDAPRREPTPTRRAHLRSPQSSTLLCPWDFDLCASASLR